MNDKGIIILLCIMLIASNLFWFWQVNMLVNKLMCKNFGEYVQAKGSAKPRAKPKEEPEQLSPFEEHRLKELNQIFSS